MSSEPLIVRQCVTHLNNTEWRHVSIPIVFTHFRSLEITEKNLINHENHHNFNVSIRNSFGSHYLSKWFSFDESYSPTLVGLYLKYFAIFHQNSLFMVAVDCWYIVNWVWNLTILCVALLVQSSRLLNKNYGIVILLRSTVPGSQHRHSTYQFLFMVNVNTNTLIFTGCCSVLFICWVSLTLVGILFW